ncbi:hypothetical protein RHMOL_Rhmol08G0315900 [Rhododendron molle]|uniref:Uncharacterized protein n=1 Tax=Rhododendron molle TaxID=49168 RepID=A0ACC0MVN5_RHOML|nr:hypothetical protein RHMOL_Rhmol08G0315900 [Rhododendron molle]
MNNLACNFCGHEVGHMSFECKIKKGKATFLAEPKYEPQMNPNFICLMMLEFSPGKAISIVAIVVDPCYIVREWVSPLYSFLEDGVCSTVLILYLELQKHISAVRKLFGIMSCGALG